MDSLGATYFLQADNVSPRGLAITERHPLHTVKVTEHQAGLVMSNGDSYWVKSVGECLVKATAWMNQGVVPVQRVPQQWALYRGAVGHTFDE